jgi:dATP pyrophosphohydrolase
MRAPFQILAVPYRFIKGELCFCVFRRSDSNIWQFIAGGGEDNEKPLDAAMREIKEETGVVAEQLTELKSVAFVPAEVVAENMRTHWDKNIFVIPEYSFAFECNADPTLSCEHSEYKWLSYNDARKLLKWDSNKAAMYEIMCRL